MRLAALLAQASVLVASSWSSLHPSLSWRWWTPGGVRACPHTQPQEPLSAALGVLPPLALARSRVGFRWGGHLVEAPRGGGGAPTQICPTWPLPISCQLQRPPKSVLAFGSRCQAEGALSPDVTFDLGTIPVFLSII